VQLQLMSLHDRKCEQLTGNESHSMHIPNQSTQRRQRNMQKQAACVGITGGDCQEQGPSRSYADHAHRRLLAVPLMRHALTLAGWT
jgi:hypothetical protein